MDQLDLDRKDLEALIGSRARVSEVLSVDAASAWNDSPLCTGGSIFCEILIARDASWRAPVGRSSFTPAETEPVDLHGEHRHRWEGFGAPGG